MTSRTKSRVGVRLLAAAAALATAIGLAGCSTEGGTGGNAGEQPVQGGSAVIISSAAVANWDPTIVSLGTIPGVATDRFIAVYGVLFYVDVENQLQPSIGESLTTEDDVVWTLKLTEGVEFSDGTPLDAAAVKYNYDRAKRDASAIKAFASTIESEVVDETTLELTLSEPNPIFDRQLTESLNFIVSPAALEEQGEDYNHPVGAGPFVLESWDQTVGEEFVRNENYFLEGKPYLDRLTFSIITDPAQRVSTVVQGGGDLMNNYVFAILDSIGSPGTTVTGIASGGTRSIIMNNSENSVFSDARLRKAAALAIDTTAMVQTLTQDPEEEGWTGLFGPQSPYLDEDYLAETGDVEAAKELVAEAVADGVDVNIEITAAVVPETIRAAELLQLQLNEVGFNATIVQIPLADWRAFIFNEKVYDISFYPGIFDLNNAPVQFTALFAGRENLSNFSSPEMDAAIEAVQNAKGDDELAEAFSEVQRIYAEEVPFIVFGFDERIFFHQERLAGLTPTGRGALLFENLWRTDLAGGEED